MPKSKILNQIVAATEAVDLHSKVLETFNRASDTGDFYHVKTREFIARGGVELRVAVRAAASVIKPKLYLGVGVRYGWSDAQALAEMGDMSDAILVDLWEENYAGLPTRGADYARQQIEQMVGHSLTYLSFVNSNSHVALPVICQNQQFDMAVIDGDHRATGLWADICDVFPSITVGGVVVVDDLFSTAHEHQLGLASLDVGDRKPYPWPGVYSLRYLWEHLPEHFPNFAYWHNSGPVGDESGHPFGTSPVGIAVRVK